MRIDEQPHEDDGQSGPPDLDFFQRVIFGPDIYCIEANESDHK